MVTWEYKGANPGKRPRWFHFFRRARRIAAAQDEAPVVAELRAAVAEEEIIIPAPKPSDPELE